MMTAEMTIGFGKTSDPTLAGVLWMDEWDFAVSGRFHGKCAECVHYSPVPYTIHCYAAKQTVAFPDVAGLARTDPSGQTGLFIVPSFLSFFFFFASFSSEVVGLLSQCHVANGSALCPLCSSKRISQCVVNLKP